MRVTLFQMGFPEYVMGLANALAAEDGVEVTVVQPEASLATSLALANNGVTFRAFAKPLKRRELSNIAAASKAFQLVRESRPDIVHAQEMFDYGYDFRSIFDQLPNLVTTVHDVTPHPGDGHAAPGLQYSKAAGFWRSRRLIAHTAGMRNQLARRFRIAPDRIDVIPHGELGSLYARLARQAGVVEAKREPYTLLFFGRIWSYKGLRYLLEAFASLQQSLPHARLIIAGRGGDLEANASLISSLQGVEVLNSFIPEANVAGLFERSSLVVLPYVEASQSGVSAIGFTLGTVVVASRVGGLAELIRNGVNGVLVEPRNSIQLAEAIKSLLLDPSRQQRIRQKAYVIGESELGWSQIAKATLATYGRVLQTT